MCRKKKSTTREGSESKQELLMLSFFYLSEFSVRDFLIAVEGDKFKVCLSIEVFYSVSEKDPSISVTSLQEGKSCSLMRCERRKKGFPRARVKMLFLISEIKF